MIKQIKGKIKFYKRMVIEILETMCTICLYLEREGHMYKTQNPNAERMGTHYQALKWFSEQLRYEEEKRNGEKDGMHL